MKITLRKLSPDLFKVAAVLLIFVVALAIGIHEYGIIALLGFAVPLRKDSNPLETVLLGLSPVDPWTALDACEGTFICGSPGSGKSSTAGKQITLAFLRAGWGGLVCVAKSEETRNWIECAKATGREGSLSVFSAASGHAYDAIFYEWNRPGRGTGDLEALIDVFTTLLAIGKPHSGYSTDRFWDLAVEQLMRNVIVLLALAGERISIASMNRVIDSLPTRPGEFEEEGWQNESFCASLIGSIRDRKESLTEAEWNNLDLATRFVCRKWPEMDERPRSSVHMTWSGMADKFLFEPLASLFCAGICTFLPEHTTHANRIILVDFPLLEYGHETGRLINCLMKISFQRAWLRRDATKYPNPAFLYADECQYFVLPRGRDNAFQQTCRSARIATVYITQNILNLAEELGEHVPGAKTKAWLANLSLKIAFQQNCYDTNSYMADLIGKEYRYLRNVGMGGQNAHIGAHETLAHIVEAHAFTQLRKPDTRQPIAEAICYLGGKGFNATKTTDCPEGRNYLKTGFSR